MKTKFTFLALFLFGLMTLSFYSCSDDNPEVPEGGGTNTGTEGANSTINKWIYKEMSEYYLWNDKMPDSTAVNYSSDPYDFFQSLLYNYQTLNGDRFSRMEGTHENIPKAASESGSGDLGFEYGMIQFTNSTGQATGDWGYLVLYTKKGTNAETKLKRGQIITKVDGTGVNSSNRFNLLYQGKSSYTFTLNDYEQQKVLETNVQLTANYAENPILLDSIYTYGTKKIGYIVYNSYEAGGEAAQPYDVEMANVFTRFKNNGVNNVILDLRYNGGGLVRSARYIVSALVPNRSTSKIFEVMTYNPTIQAELDKLADTNATKISYMYDYFTDNVANTSGKILASIPRLGDQLENIYVIGTQFTASASEMTINTLRPYVQENGGNVYLIGETTVGKNVGSWPIYEENNANNTYVMWPITFRTHNKLYPKAESSNYASGFTPDVSADDFALLSSGLKNFGDENETLLQTTLSKILGQSLTKSTNSAESMIQIKGTSLEKKKIQGNMVVIEKDQLKSLKSDK